MNDEGDESGDLSDQCSMRDLFRFGLASCLSQHPAEVSTRLGTMLSLVVDDDPDIRAYIKQILKRDGFETLEAGGGNAALEIVKLLDGCLDLIVTDIQMPEGDGLSFANAVR